MQLVTSPLCPGLHRAGRALHPLAALETPGLGAAHQGDPGTYLHYLLYLQYCIIYSTYLQFCSIYSTTVPQYRVHCSIQVSLVWPVLYILATVFITIVPMVAKPLETGLGCLIILTAVPVYFIFLYWENKPPAIRKFLSKNIMLSVR